MNEKFKEYPGYSYKDIVWEHINNKNLKYYRYSDFDMYRNCHFSMEEFLEEGKIDSVFMYLAEVLRIDLRGVTNGVSMAHLENYADDYFLYRESNCD